jgi:ATP-dependent RNA helicase DHX57
MGAIHHGPQGDVGLEEGEGKRFRGVFVGFFGVKNIKHGTHEGTVFFFPLTLAAWGRLEEGGRRRKEGGGREHFRHRVCQGLAQEGGRRKEEGGRRKEEGGRRKEEEGGRRKEGGGRKEEGGTYFDSKEDHLYTSRTKMDFLNFRHRRLPKFGWDKPLSLVLLPSIDCRPDLASIWL